MATDLRFTIEVDGISKTITSISEANKVIRELTKNFVLTKEAGQDLTGVVNQLNKALEVKQSLKMVSLGAVELKTNMAGAQTASANASMALMNLNYVIRDSPYFFNNFALGVLAVGNNLNPLIDSFNRLRQEAVGNSISAFALLKQALVGGAGISIAFSLVVTAIQSFVFWMSKADKETEKTKDNVDLLTSALNRMAKVRDPFSKRIFDIDPKDLPKLISAFDEEIKALETTGKALGGTYYSGTGETRVKIDLSNLQKENKTIEETNLKIKEYLVGQKNELLAQQRIYEAMRKAGIDMVSIEKEKTEVLKEQRRILSLYPTPRGYESMDTIRREDERLLSEKNETAWWKYGQHMSEKKPVPENKARLAILDDLNTKMSQMRTISDILGQSLTSAFNRGRFALDEFIASLTLAISKMAILKLINTFFFGGLPIASTAGSLLDKTGNPNLGGSARHIAISVDGRLRANGNEFVADFKKVENIYNNSIKRRSIVRD